MLASGLILGVIAGFAVGRTWQPLIAVRPRWVPVLLIAFTARAVAPLVPAFGLPLYVASLGGTAIAAAANRHLVGAWPIALGGALNLAVVLLNGGMPVDSAALASVGGVMPTDALHVIFGPTTQLGFLADLIPIPPVRGVYSVGDFAIAVGGFLIPFVVLARK